MSNERFTVRRDEAGYATAIEFEGVTVLHLHPGTVRNEQTVGHVVKVLNLNCEDHIYRSIFWRELVGQTKGGGK